MRCPTIGELPPPPPGKTGWPWTVESPQLPDTMDDRRPWPRISIVTPSYNQGQFIEETIRSILLQGYPNLEFIIIDGGSLDGTISVIERYKKWITFWVSEKDSGQSAAINKGLDWATGDWVNWINSDDILEIGGLGVVGLTGARQAMSIRAIAFKCGLIDVYSNNQYRILSTKTSDSIWTYLNDSSATPQPSTFFRGSCVRVDEGLNFVMDWALHFSIIEKWPRSFMSSGEIIAYYRFHNDTKTSKNFPIKFRYEGLEYLSRYEYSTFLNKLAADLFIIRSRARAKFISKRPSLGWCVIMLIRAPILIGDRFFLGAFKRTIFALKAKF